MKKTKKFFINASMMVLTTVALRIVSLYFSIYLSRTIGEVGIGIWSLTGSVFRLGITLSSAGVGFAVTRVVAEEIEKNNPREASRVARRSLAFSFALGTIIALFFFLFATPVATRFLSEPRAIPSIRIMSVSFPFIVMSSVINSYFIAVGRLKQNAVSMIVDQIIRIAVTVISLSNFDGQNLSYACISLALGSVFAEIISFTVGFFYFCGDIKRLNFGTHKRTPLLKRVSSIAMPVAISSVIRTSLHSIEHMMIPSGLRKRGVSPTRALGIYGMITGMVFPVIMFPSAFLYSASDLLVPEFSACLASGNNKRLKRLTLKVMQLTSFFAVGVSGIIFGFSEEIGLVFYNSAECSTYIKLLAPLIVFMLYDHVADAILKGLGEQVSVVKYNVIDSVVSVVLVALLVESVGISGYIFVVWFGEVMNTVMSGTKLAKRTKTPIKFFRWFFLPILAVTASVVITRTVLTLLHGSVAHDMFSLIVAFIISGLIYMIFLRASGEITLNDYKLMRKAFS